MVQTNNLLQNSIIATTAIVIFHMIHQRKQRKKKKQKMNYESLIGNTPLIHLEKLSTLVKRQIYVKMECLNPGGTGKDRAALFMLKDAEAKSLLPPSLSLNNNHYPSRDNDGENDPPHTTIYKSANTHDTPSPNTANLSSSSLSYKQDVSISIASTIQTAISRTKTGGIVCEGTSGSTGISLATLCAQRGHAIILVLPDDQAEEKRRILQCLGAVVHITQNTAISNPNHYVNIARRIAEEINQCYGRKNDESTEIKAVFTNQFENVANYHAHYSTTGPEIWSQSDCNIGAFCMSSGTGGTISGTGKYLKEQSITQNGIGNQCKVVLIDPPGSALYNKVKFNVAYTSQQREQSLRRHRYDTIAEGIGLDRITKNFSLGIESNSIDDALRISDQEAVDMAHWLLREEGLFIGSSSAMNVVGAAKLAHGACGEINKSQSIVTVICDGGQRHLSRFWNRDFIIREGLEWPDDDICGWEKRLQSSLYLN